MAHHSAKPVNLRDVQGPSFDALVDPSEGYIRVGVRVRPLMANRGVADAGLKIDTAKAKIEDDKGHTFEYASVFFDEDNEAIFERSCEE